MRVKKIIFVYDNSNEEQLNDLICTIDASPIICTSPLEESSYLGVNLYSGEEEFQIFVQLIYDRFKEYTDYIIQKKSANLGFYNDLESTLTRFLINYQNAHTRFIDSTLRTEWKHKAAHYFIPNPQNDNNISKQEECTRLAYNFFHKMSSIQLFFIDKVISYLSQQLNPFKKSDQDVPQSKSIALIEESEPVYFFTLTESASHKRTLILGTIYEGLKNSGYIDCAPPEFKRLFINYNDKKPTSTPPAIIWNCKYYNHLGYFIHCIISGKVISYAKLPSNNKIALNLFHNGKEGNPYSTKGKRYGGRLNPKDKAKINGIIKDSLKKSELTTIQIKN
jgi:hypothetical protein